MYFLLVPQFFIIDPKSFIVRTKAFIYEQFGSLRKIKITDIDGLHIFFTLKKLFVVLASKKLNNFSFK